MLIDIYLVVDILKFFKLSLSDNFTYEFIYLNFLKY